MSLVIPMLAIVVALASAIDRQSASGARGSAVATADRGTWMSPIRLSGDSRSWFPDIASGPTGRVHVIWTNDGLEYRALYRRSSDGGRTWSSPSDLSASPGTGSTHPQIIADDGGVLHLSWDEGFDNATGRGTRATSLYRSSSDGGKTWSQPSRFGRPDMLSVQLVVTSRGATSDRLAVWRSQTEAHVYYQASDDSGQSWSEPLPIPGIRPRPYNSPWYDQYALVTDRTRSVQLVLVGREPADDTWKVLHLRFSDSKWSTPHVVFGRPGLFPEYPRAAVDPSNRLYAVWFTRTDLWKRGATDVWYSATGLP